MYIDMLMNNIFHISIKNIEKDLLYIIDINRILLISCDSLAIQSSILFILSKETILLNKECIHEYLIKSYTICHKSHLTHVN